MSLNRNNPIIPPNQRQRQPREDSSQQTDPSMLHPSFLPTSSQTFFVPMGSEHGVPLNFQYPYPPQQFNPTPAPHLQGSQLPLAQPPAAIAMHGSGANPHERPRVNDHPIYSPSVGTDAASTNSGFFSQNASAIHSPGRSVSSMLSPGPSASTTPGLLSPMAPPEPRHCTHRHRQESEASTRPNQHPVPQRFMCEWSNCSNLDGFETKQVLLRHVREQHIYKDGESPCGRCGRRFKRSYRLQEHIESKHRSSAMHPSAPVLNFNEWDL